MKRPANLKADAANDNSSKISAHIPPLNIYEVVCILAFHTDGPGLIHGCANNKVGLYGLNRGLNSKQPLHPRDVQVRMHNGVRPGLELDPV